MEGTCFIKKIVEIEKKSQANWDDCNRFHSKHWRRTVPETFFIKIQKKSHLSQGGQLFFTQKVSNSKICFAVFVFNQIHNNFNFEELSSQKSFKIFIGKIKILKVVY